MIFLEESTEEEPNQIHNIFLSGMRRVNFVIKKKAGLGFLYLPSISSPRASPLESQGGSPSTYTGTANAPAEFTVCYCTVSYYRRVLYVNLRFEPQVVVASDVL